MVQPKFDRCTLFFRKFSVVPHKPEVALGWDFLGIPNPRSPSRGLGMGIFHFGLDQKNPRGFEIPGMGIGDFGSGGQCVKMNFIAILNFNDK